MKKLAFVIAAAATIGLSMTAVSSVPAAAQDIHVRVGDGKVRVGEGYGHNSRGYHRDWHPRRHCTTFWRHGHRVTTCN